MHARLEQEQAALQRGVDDGLRELRGRLLRRAVLDELEREHRADPAHVADRGEALLPVEHPSPHRLADLNRALAEVLLLDHVEDGERGRLRDRVADVGAADGAVVRRVEDLGLAEHARERSLAAIDFATVIRSGSTPECSIAKSLPVRAKPVCTSSAIRQMPCSSQIARRPSRNAFGAGRKPPRPARARR